MSPVILVLSLMAQPSDQEGVAFFEQHIRPRLAERCYPCHSRRAEEVKANLYLDTRDGVRRGGDSGPAVVPLDPEGSLLIRAVRADGELAMPPDETKRFSTEEVRLFEAWVSLGAPDPRTGGAGDSEIRAAEIDEARRSWPYTPIEDPPAPDVERHEWPLGEIDRFILARLEEEGIAPVPEADRRTLIRRVTFDLIGLPPTPEEIDAFLADESHDAWPRLVDRLLASPHYGERWGRHWLDVARYADTAGDNSDYPVPQLYLYRNWVIDSLNADTSYDRFVTEQLAGDLLPFDTPEERRRNLIATGYLANAKRFGSRVHDYPWHLTIEDTLDNLGKAFLGLTVGCARCHDHKFDPVSTEDYYALYGIFASTRYPWPGIELDKTPRDLVPLAPPRVVEGDEARRREKRKELDATVRRLEEEIRTAERELGEARKKESGGSGAERAPAKARVEDLRRKLAGAKAERDRIAKGAPGYPTAYAVWEGKEVGDARIQVKGQPHNPGKEVPRRFLEVLGGPRLTEGNRRSGRLELAGWITDPRNPLTARVLVNRLWHHHFGRGLVPTPNNFGKQGRPPRHPGLLDHLASRFIGTGWSIKAVQRSIVLSRTYRLSSETDERAARVDPGNELFWRRDRRRLEAEAVRDALLAVSGGLDRSVAREPHPFPPQETWGFTQHHPFKDVYETRRRSVYLMTQRIVAHPFLGLFDGAETNASTADRPTTTTPLQALYFLNNAFVHEQAAGFARRILEAGLSDDERIDRAYALAFGRPPAEDEARSIKAALERFRRGLADGGEGPAARERKAWESVARALLRTNEFIHVE